LSASRVEPRPLPEGVARLLISAEEIRARVQTIADEIARDVGGELFVLGVLNGSLIFLADLVRRLPMRVRYDMIRASSYRAGRSSGAVRIESPPDASLITGRDVLVVDDILDTGRTLSRIRELVLAARPRSLRTAVMLSKRVRRDVEVPVDYVGFEIDEGFVVGYGLDYEGRFRDLPYVGLLDPDWSPATP
jgi:hypoxanthine phosphoribosyltransferase